MLFEEFKEITRYSFHDYINFVGMNKSSRSEKKAALLAATFAAFLTPFLGAALNVALPSIAKEFNADAILLNLTATVYLLSTAMFLLPFGRLGDIVGRKKVFSLGLVVFTVSVGLGAVAPSMILLIVFRVFQGIGSAMIFGTGIAILTSIFPPGERGRALGINVAAVYIGLSLGPVVGGLLTQYLGWRSIFWILVPIGIFAFILLRVKIRSEWAEAKGEGFDWKGSLFYMFTLLFLMIGFSILPDWYGYIFILVGGISLYLFIRFESRMKNPLLEVSLFRLNRVFAFSNLAALINYSATFGVGFLLSLYLQYIKGLEPRDAGMILVVQPLIMAIFSPLTGRLSDRIQAQIIASVGMIFTTIGLVLLIFLGMDAEISHILFILSLLGIGFALFSSPNTNAIMSSVERKHMGVASGAVGTMRMIGQMLSMSIVLILFSVLIGKAELSPDVHEEFLRSMQIAFLIFAILCFGGIFASVARGKVMKV